ncbi:TerC family protein [Virgibacillus ihumii]|uniref:TerC family protein n=1 Tax=Virgibacillus ihumii TaxID=2686091 RepID=UPI00157C5303|nr:TerC family protein [Virgibacillus ihumii]
MDSALILQYAWTLLILIGLEGLLSADNALVLAVIAKHLPEKQKKRAIDYGIYMAFIFRFAAIFLISFIAGIWQVQAIGAAYLIYLGGKHVYKEYFSSKESEEADPNKAGMGFWPTVAKIGVADVAFAIDSILAAVALAVTLPVTPLPQFGGMDGGRFAVIVLASIAGLVLIKFAANWFVKLLEKRPGLEMTAYLIVGWVGIKLAVITLSHEQVSVLPEGFAHSTVWTIFFWTILLGIAIIGWFVSGKTGSKKRSNESSS